MKRARLRGLSLALLVGGMFSHGGCYRAVIDIAETDAGGTPGGGDGGDGGGGGDGGATAAACDPTPLDDADVTCRGILPTKAQCSVQDPKGWNGCYDGGCEVCADVAQDYPFYFKWHPCCQANLKCTSDVRVKCNARCPPPVARDQVMPCWAETSNL